MHKDEFIKQFSYRLRESMIAAGYHSNRSPSGVDLKVLQTITGYSVQICRKYLRGESLPEISKIIDIADYLHISPGWLLFGETHSGKQNSAQYIHIHQSLLYRIFLEICQRYDNHQDVDDIPELLLSLTKDITHINAPVTELQKIIELTLSSAFNFRKRQGVSK